MTGQRKRQASLSSDDGPAKSRRQSGNGTVEGMYLDTVNRANLDFDFGHLCSVSLSDQNVYACLVCGRYYQGRGKQTHAYFHSINDDHHVFINLTTLRAYVLPDNYEIKDKALNDIKAAIRPRYSLQDVQQLDKLTGQCHDLAGKGYLRGLVGLNRVKCNDYMNAIFQALAQITPIRDALLLLPDLDNQTLLVQRTAELMRKMWHSKLFKAHISPHELVQEVAVRSKKRFRLDCQGNAFEFLTWLLNTLHLDLGGTRKRSSSVIYQTFQGRMRTITTESDATSKVPFLVLSLELPPNPLFVGDEDDDKGTAIPQVSLMSLLERYNGNTAIPRDNASKRYQITELPPYVICHIKRFSQGEFSVDKNDTVVNFPITSMLFGGSLPTGHNGNTSSTYDLVANICHDGCPLQTKSDNTSPSDQNLDESASSGSSNYLTFVFHEANNKWYQMQDLNVQPVMPQIQHLSSTVIQIWRRTTRIK